MKQHTNRISETVIFEAYFDLWGFTMPWIDAICDKLLDFSCPSRGDNCEAYRCEANMSVRFQSIDKARVEQAKRLFVSLSALATAAMKRPANKTEYHVICG